jgi:hypothetical protein
MPGIELNSPSGQPGAGKPAAELTPEQLKAVAKEVLRLLQKELAVDLARRGKPTWMNRRSE